MEPSIRPSPPDSCYHLLKLRSEMMKVRVDLFRRALALLGEDSYVDFLQDPPSFV